MGPHLVFVGGEDHDLRLPFVARFAERGYRVTAVSSGRCEPFLSASIGFRAIAFARHVDPVADVKALGRLARTIENIQPDLVQCFDTKLNVLVPLALRNADLPIVRTLNGRGWLYASRSVAARTLRPIHRRLTGLAGRYAWADVFEHGADQAFFSARGMSLASEKRVIPGAGSDVEAIRAAAQSGATAARLRAELGLTSKRVIITVSRLTRQKGIGTLLKAAEIVHASHQDVRFLLVGPRESEGSLAISKAELDRHAPYVVTTGARDDVPSLLNAADIFAFPTEYCEGIPRVLCEAAILGLPIVAAGMPGCREVIDDGQNGLIVPPGAPVALAAAIGRMLDDPTAARAMGRTAAQRVGERFGIETIVAQYDDLYHAILATHRPDIFETPVIARRPRRPNRAKARTAEVT